MVAYLAEGWFAHTAPRHLRSQVVDGALDTAGFLHRASLPAEAVLRVAMRLRALTSFVDPIHRHVNLGVKRAEHASRALPQRAKDVVRTHMAEATDPCIELQSFVQDCLDHVSDLDALRGLFLHLIHIAQVMRLLAVARESAAVHALVAAHDELTLTAQTRISRPSGH